MPPLYALDDPAFAQVPKSNDFQSPFPSTFQDGALDALGVYSAENFAAQGATAWATGTQIAMVVKAVGAGDLRSDWFDQLVKEDPSGALSGFFASVHFTPSTDPKVLEKNMVNTAFNIAGGIVSAIPIYGQIIAGVLEVAQFLYNLFQVDEPQRKALVPWKEYSQGLDEDRCIHVVFPQMNYTEWTRLFWPILDWEKGWRLHETEEGENTRAWGTFPEAGGPARYTTNAPGGKGGGLGFIPGTQKMSDVIQLVIGGRYMSAGRRVDALTATGSFYPATAQICTSLWEQVMKAGSPDMYKVRSGQLHDAWEAYFDAMRQSFADEWNWRWAKGAKGNHRDELVNLGKVQQPVLMAHGANPTLEGVNGRWAWPGMTRKTGAWQQDPNDGRPFCVAKSAKEIPAGDGWFDKGYGTDIHYQAGEYWPPDRCYSYFYPAQKQARISYMDTTIVLPAVRALQVAQHRALYRTEVCAYLRPRALPGLPQYSAFDDNTAGIEGYSGSFGDQLIERCEHARTELLKHDLRFKVRLRDVEQIDPPFAQKLRASGVKEDSWKRGRFPMAASAGAALGTADEIAPSRGPQGGTPFASAIAKPSGGGGAGGLLIGAAAIAAFAVLRGR